MNNPNTPVAQRIAEAVKSGSRDFLPLDQVNSLDHGNGRHVDVASIAYRILNRRAGDS
jgi:hypothetical protein